MTTQFARSCSLNKVCEYSPPPTLTPAAAALMSENSHYHPNLGSSPPRLEAFPPSTPTKQDPVSSIPEMSSASAITPLKVSHPPKTSQNASSRAYSAHYSLSTFLAASNDACAFRIQSKNDGENQTRMRRNAKNASSLQQSIEASKNEKIKRFDDSSNPKQNFSPQKRRFLPVIKRSPPPFKRLKCATFQSTSSLPKTSDEEPHQKTRLNRLTPTINEKSHHKIDHNSCAPDFTKRLANRCNKPIKKGKSVPPKIGKKSRYPHRVVSDWCPVGNGNMFNVKVCRDQHIKQKLCFHAIRHRKINEIVHVGDCVKIHAGEGNLENIGRILSIHYSEEECSLHATLFWYYTQTQLDSKTQIWQMDNKEILASKHLDTVNVDSIESVAYVLTFNEYCRFRAETEIDSLSTERQPIEEAELWSRGDDRYKRRKFLPHDDSPIEMVYFCRGIYSIKSKKVHTEMKNAR